MSLQVCHCGWSKVTSYHGLRTHQGKMGCTPRGMNIPKSQQLNYLPIYSNPPALFTIKEPFIDIFKSLVRSDSASDMSLQVSHSGWSKETDYKGLRNHQDNQWGGSQKENRPSICNYVKEEQLSVIPASQIYTSSMNPPPTQARMDDTYKPFFETPTRSPQTLSMSSDKARRGLDFSAGIKMENLWEPPTTKAQDREISLKKKQKEEGMETEKMWQTTKDRMKADLQQKIHIREQKMVEVRSSAKTSKASLDAEWLEINSVFTEVISIVEDTRQKALEPLEKRRQKMKREKEALLMKLQKEIDKLKDSIDELDTHLQASPAPGRHKPTGLENLSLDTSMSFGSLRATTSTMVKEIQQQLENFSSLELKRIQTFAVDVKLDSATAHRCLDVSDDLKTVRHGGEKPKAPDAPERFDMFGSVLGLNNITAGRAYWEVEVNGKTGWDLGVARRSAGRKGMLTVNTDNGFWVTVRYEGKKYAALTVPPVSLSLKGNPHKVGVFVDYEEGLVSFYDVTAQSHIFSFTGCSFDDEIVPYFSPHLNGNGRNAGPLIISAMHKH